MGFLQLATARYSVRAYSRQPVEKEWVDVILEAARVAPTACNRQPQRIMVITTPDELAKVDECTPCRFGAPLVFLICYDMDVCWKRSFDGANSGDVDASIITTHMMMQAHELGLGSCWVMYFDPAKTRELFNLPEHIIPVAYLPVGYPVADAKPADGHTKSVGIKEMLL